MITEDAAARWAARPVQARLIRLVVFLLPIAGSVVFVHFASGAIEMPTSSFLLFISWWVLMSGAATAVLIVLDRLARRLLPLVALLNLSLVFPDEAPSRFRTALRSNTVESLEQRLARARALPDGSATVGAAEQLLALVAELDTHDRVTRGHSERVRAYAQIIGKELHLKPGELDALNWAALVHDVGKLKVPAEILNKPGKPTEEEWAVLRRHTEFGDELVAPLESWLGEWSHAVGQHHERWNGHGYPSGLSGDEISLAARIVAVADVFDVITSARSYKPSFSAATARQEIALCAGTYFDPGVVRAFLNVSLGRLRLVMGPLAWLAHAPILGRLPLTPAIGTLGVSMATVAAALTTGLLATSTPPGQASTGAPPIQARAEADRIDRVTREDESIVVGVEPAVGGAKVISLRVVTQPSAGHVRVTAANRLLYTPPPGFSGEVSVRYAACWSGHGCREGVLTVRVLQVNDSPTARDDRATTQAGAPVSIGVLANDSDPDGDPLSIVSISDPGAARTRLLRQIVLRSGTAVGAAQAEIVGRRIRWSPPPGFAGTASFRYTVTDGHGGRASALVTIRVTGPTASEPAPSPEQPQMPAGAPSPAATPPPAPGSEPETPSPSRQDLPPRARDDRVSVPEGRTVSVDVLANDTDPDGGALSLVSVGSPSRGTARRVGDTVRFTAPPDYVGPVSFPYTVVDGQGARDSATVSVTVLLVNAPPSFTLGRDVSVLEDAGPQSVPGWAANIEPGPTSEAGQAVSFAVAADNQSLFAVQPEIDPGGALTYTPAPNAYGSANVTVRAKDDGGTASGGSDTSGLQTFTLTVAPVNDPPVARNDDAGVAEDDEAGVTFDVLANDTDVDTGDTLSVFSFDSPADASGTLTHTSGGSFTYIPESGFAGTETFTYVAVDSSGAASSATVTIVVTAVQHAPVAGNDSYVVQLDTKLEVALPGVLANDGDPDGDAITLQTTPVGGPAKGSVVLAADGSFGYTPFAGATGSDSFAYRIVDETGRPAEGIVTLTIASGPSSAATFFFQSAGLTSEIWDMTAAPPPAAPQLADFDGDGHPGLTIKSSSGQEAIERGRKFQIWTYTAPAPVVLDGPVTLSLWSSSGPFHTIRKGRIFAYLYDCTPGGAADPAWTGCTDIASNTVFADPWNTSLSDWSFRLVTIGSVTRTIPAGHELRIKLLWHARDLWLMMSAGYPTGLIVTLGP